MADVNHLAQAKLFVSEAGKRHISAPEHQRLLQLATVHSNIALVETMLAWIDEFSLVSKELEAEPGV